MTRELGKDVIKTAIGASIYFGTILASERMELSQVVEVMLFLTSYLIIAFEVIKRWILNLIQKQLSAEHVLIIIATTGALHMEKYVEGIAVILIYQTGYIVWRLAFVRSRRSIVGLLDIKAPHANLKVKRKEVQVDPSELKVGDIVIIKPGERVPADCVVTSGVTSIDIKALTGEIMPREIAAGDRIYSGSINLTGVLEARILRTSERSAASRIISMVEEAGRKKATAEISAFRYSNLYALAIMSFAAVLIFIPDMMFLTGDEDIWMYRGLIFLVAGVPCAIVMSIPITFLAGIGAAAKNGVVVKGGNYLESLAMADTFVFDKTGTLTKGVFEVQEVKAMSVSERDLLRIVAHAEVYSNHPVSASLRNAYSGKIYKRRVKQINEIPGQGVSAMYQQKQVYVGNEKLMKSQHIEVPKIATSGTVVYAAYDGKFAGYFVLSDHIKEDAYQTIHELKKNYHANLVMLSGDKKEAGNPVGHELNMDEIASELMPEHKLEYVEDLLEVQSDKERVVYVGDGINDAPVLVRADVGIAMGGLGTEAVIEAADVVLLEDELSKIIVTIRIARETLKVVSQNIKYAYFVKALVLVFAILGFLSMWEVILAEIGTVILTTLNSMWVMKNTE